MKGRCSAVLALFLVATQLASLSAARPDESRPPANLHVDLALQLLVERMWKASPTFQRQCRRLADEPSVLVTLSREDPSAGPSLANAWTALTFKGNTLVAAQVHIKPASNGAELIAH